MIYSKNTLVINIFDKNKSYVEEDHPHFYSKYF